MVRRTILCCSAVAALQYAVFYLVGKFACAKMSARDEQKNARAKIRLRDDSFVKNRQQKRQFVMKDVQGEITQPVGARYSILQILAPPAITRSTKGERNKIPWEAEWGYDIRKEENAVIRPKHSYSKIRE